MTCIEIYTVLQISSIEGIEVLASRFKNIYKNMEKKGYDALDHRKIDFDYDFEDFRTQMGELEVSIWVCLKIWLSFGYCFQLDFI